MAEEKVPHLVFVPIPGVGHLLPALDLAKDLCTRRPFTITFLLIPPLIPSSELASFLSTLTTSFPTFSFIHLPTITTPPIPAASRRQTRIAVKLDLYKPHVRSALPADATAVVLDFFCANMLDDCLDLAIPPYIFFTSSASMLALMLYAPVLDLPATPKAIDEEFAAATVPFPGYSSPFPLAALPDEFAHGRDEVYDIFLGFGRSFRRAKGILVNTFEELQGGVLGALEEGLYDLPGHPPVPPVYPVGPLLAPVLETPGGSECIRWLDSQPRGSVVFLCFGSLGRFPRAQVAEMAAGLEASGWRFLWVMRDEGLPEGFEERTRERGLVWRSFAPQKEVLRHEAVGGFVTHCGWNSTLEGVWFGVPMAAWPLYAEQHWNAHEMVREMGVAVEVRTERRRGDWAAAAEVERAVRELMGNGREKTSVLSEKARKALQDGGSSHRAIARLVELWSRSPPHSTMTSVPP